MAGIAAYGRMGAGQFEFCIPVMVEDKLLPFLLVMTFPALIAVAPGMHVIDAVTGNAFRR